MAVYPFPEKIQSVVSRMTTGNFGLWYNKFVPLSGDFKASNDSGDVTKVVDYYLDRYKKMKETPSDLLRKKHQHQSAYCLSFPQSIYEMITIRATLETPLVTGVGESHPHEVSMVFDHNLGIPYIPASGVKGIVRFAHTLVLWERGIPQEYLKTDEKKDLEYIDDESYESIYGIFGNQKNRGKVIFLDAYPEKVPDLDIDIMNPHYGAYYGDLQKKTPPADYLSPNPIKFLTVAQGTIFIFRAIAEKRDDIPQKVREALRRALTEEGVGAKTAVGYGRFEIMNDDQTVLDQRGAVSTKTTVQPPPVEEVWENAFVSFNAGSGGVVTAQSSDKKTATIRGKEKAAAITDASLHKKLFDGKKTLPKVRVTARKTGNAWVIVKVEPAE